MTPIKIFDKAVERSSRRLAGGYSRRSFLGQVGSGALALSLGGLAADVSDAEAECGPCNTGTDSVSCGFLTGSNHCPGNSCTGGWWVAGGEPCAAKGEHTLWADCLGECASCTCHNENGICRPSCCYTKQWGGGCHAGERIYIKCRVWNCTNLPINSNSGIGP